MIKSDLFNIIFFIMSDFWKRVDEELEYKGINRAFLARKCNFSVTNIGQGIKLNSTPSAETAVKIANVLGVSVEYLVLGINPKINQNLREEQKQLRLFRKYKNLIENCEQLAPKKIQILNQIAEEFKS